MALKEEGQNVKNRAHWTFGPVSRHDGDMASLYINLNSFAGQYTYMAIHNDTR